MKIKNIFNSQDYETKMKEFREDISRGMKERWEYCRKAIIRDREDLEMIESVLQKASPKDPIDKKVTKPLLKLKKVLLNQIKLYENILARK